MLPTAYKVVYEMLDLSLTSATYMGKKAQYSTCEWTRPSENNGPLAVFETLGHAVSWKKIQGDPGLEIFECEYVPAPHPCSVWVYYWDGLTRHFAKLPPGTVLAWSVKLLRRVV